MLHEATIMYDAYKAAQATANKLRPKDIYFHDSGIKLAKEGRADKVDRLGVCIQYQPGEKMFHIMVYNPMQSNGAMYCDLRNLDKLIEALELFRSGDINNLPDGWYTRDADES